MTSKTIALSGAEIRADYSGGTNAWLRNDGTATVYASTAPGVTAGADGTVSIPAGQAAAIYGVCGAVYLLGTGSVMLVGSDYTACPFKTSAQSGGSGADSVARAAIEAHAGNADIHVTADEKAYWNTLSGKNELDNPDFRVNQRGQNEYSTGYTVDRWYISTDKCKAAPETNGIRLTATATLTSNTHAFWQNNEFPLPPGKYTLSLKAADVTGVWAARIRTVTAAGDYVDSYYTPRLQAGINSVTVDLSDSEYISAVSIGFNKGTEAGNSLKLAWAKLEGGSLATPFVPPDYAAELAKCQRFYQVRTTNDIDPLDMRPSMRTITDIKAVEGGYAYVAEL
nr:MAG TPA: tail fiber protein [Caudoviricetes sp.]